MRILIRVFAGLGLLGALAVVALAVMLPRLVQSDEVRKRIREAAHEATGRDFEYAELDVGLMPPRLVVTKASLAGEVPSADPMLEGADVQLRLSLLPLLARAVVVDSLVVEGATLRLVRTADGFQLPEPPKSDTAPAPAGAADSPAEADAGVALAVRRIALRNVRLVVEDRSVTPAVTWDLQDLAAKVSGDSLEGPLDVDLSTSLASGGRFSVAGQVTLSGALDLVVDLDALDLAPAAPYLGKGRRVAGKLTGRVTAKGESAEDPALVLDLRLADATVVMDELELKGGAHVEADLERISAPRGRFALDATQAALRYGEAFQKPAGTTATLEGRITPGEGGAVVLEDTRLRIKNLDATTRIETGARTRLQLQAAPFEIEGWDTLLPALADTPARGKLGFEALRVATEPLDVKGRILLDGLRIPQGEVGGKPSELVLNGALLGEGSALRSESLVAAFAGQDLTLDLRLSDLAGRPKLTLKTGLEKADSNRLLTVLAGKPDTLSGPLDVNADLALPLTGNADPSQAITGSVRFSIEPGRLKGVSLLRSAFERFGSFGEAAVVVGQAKGGRTLQRFYDDEFQSLSGTFRLADGRARSSDLRLVYRNYSVDLEGSLGLADLGLDFRGSLTLDEQVDAALAGASSEATTPQPAAIPEGGVPAARKRTLPLAKVGGTLDDPKVQLTREAVIAFATRGGSLGRQREDLSKKIDERLGEGAGGQVLDVLEGILGGRGKR